LNPEEVRASIIGENVQAFNAVKGIGPKTAKRLILDLKDKLLKESDGMPISIAAVDNTLRDEALSALVALGFARISVQKALNKIIKSQPGIRKVEDLIKLALRELS
jgi:Holliday junction DNA helicase RuvA